MSRGPVVVVHRDKKFLADAAAARLVTAIVEAQFTQTDAAKIIFHYKIKNEAGHIICTGSTTQVFVTNGSMELSLTIPDFILEWMTSVGLK